MKKLIFCLAVLSIAWNVFAQAPQKMSYQCVVRNVSGALVVNKSVAMRISILKGSPTGTVVFQETYNPNPQTNANGLISLEIGGGTPTIGVFTSIDWASGSYFLKTETDPSGGTSYSINGVSQLLSVPYAFVAKNVENDKVDDADADPTNEIQSLSKTGSTVTLSKGGGSFTDADADSTNEIQSLSISGTNLTLSKGGGNVTLPSSGGGDNWGTQTVKTNTTLIGEGIYANPLGVNNSNLTPYWANIQNTPIGFADGVDNVDDADADPANEIQTLTLSGTNLTLSKGGGTVTLPSSGGGDNWGTQTAVTNATLEGNGTTASSLKIAQQGAATGQALKWNGTSWIPGTDIANGSAAGGDLGGTYPNPAVTKIQGVGISSAAPTSGQVLSYNGVSWIPATVGGGFTLPYSQTIANGGYAFSVTNSTGSSIEGISSSTTNLTFGVRGSSSSSTNGSSGLYGINTSSSGLTQGVYGESSSVSGSGVWGHNGAGTGYTKGVFGTSSSSTGYGVYGYTNSPTGVTYGVFGGTLSPEGSGVYGSAPNTGVLGIASSTTSVAFGVYGETPSTGFNSAGVYGKSTALTGNVYGVRGETSSTAGFGIYGKNSANSGGNCGVFGESASTSGTGVIGSVTAVSGLTYGVRGFSSSPTGYGVYGRSEAASGSSSGIYGESYSPEGKGISGYAPTTGVYGRATSVSGETFGVKGETNSTAGLGVLGISSATTGFTYGVKGITASPSGAGIYGLGLTKGVYSLATSTTYLTYGIYGESVSSSNGSAGVVGNNSGSSGANYGVYGMCSSNSGMGVFGIAGPIGVKGTATYGDGIGMLGTGNEIGVKGVSEKTMGDGNGVKGISASLSGCGVYGESLNVGVKGVGANYGLSGTGTGSMSYGVYGESPYVGVYGFSTGDYAGYFLGNLVASGVLGVGVDNPAFKLDVAGTANINKNISEGVALRCNGAEALWFNGIYFSWGFGASSHNYFDKPIAIGGFVTPGANMLVVNGAAAKPGGGSWATWSDIRLKDIHGNYEKGLREITSLQPVKFTYKEGNVCKLPSDQNYVGFVAQEVQKVFPEAVSEGKDGYLTLDVNSINVALVNAIKELKAENDELKAEGDNLKAENELLKLKNEQIDSRLTNLEKIIGASAMK
jgi:hypothetical protein